MKALKSRVYFGHSIYRIEELLKLLEWPKTLWNAWGRKWSIYKILVGVLSNRDNYCKLSSPETSKKGEARFEPTKNLSAGYPEWTCTGSDSYCSVAIHESVCGNEITWWKYLTSQWDLFGDCTGKTTYLTKNCIKIFMNKKLFEVKSWVTLSNQPEITLTMGNTRKLHKGDNLILFFQRNHHLFLKICF